MKKEYQIIFVIGLFILAYILDAVVEPLTVNLPTPYHYFISPNLWSVYSFTTASIGVKTIGLVWGILWSASFVDQKYSLKAGVLIVLSAFMQLYALQDVATNSQSIPLEWSLALALAGILLLFPIAFFGVKSRLPVKELATPTEDEPIPNPIPEDKA